MSTHKHSTSGKTHINTQTQLTQATHKHTTTTHWRTQATQTHRISPQTAHTTLTENTQTGTPHVNRAPTPQVGQTRTAVHTNTHGDSRTHPDGPQPQHSPGRTPPLPADPNTNSEPDTRTHPGETPADPQPRTRALPRRGQTPPCAVTAPPPCRRHVRPPRPPGERGANNRLLLGRSPRPQEPQTPRPASRPLSPPPAGARPGCGRPSLPYPPPPLPDCGGRGSQGRLTSPGLHWPPGGAAEPAPHCL